MIEKSLISFDFSYGLISEESLDIPKLKNWIAGVVESENGVLGGLDFIFLSDIDLHELNVKYLSHDTFTDVITFDYSNDNFISGDICISIERVRENALKWSCAFDLELYRIMIHGVLHLLGYGDKSPKEKVIMNEKEDFYLSLL